MLPFSWEESSQLTHIFRRGGSTTNQMGMTSDGLGCWMGRAAFWLGHDGPKMSCPDVLLMNFAQGERHDRACGREVPWLRQGSDRAPTKIIYLDKL